MALLAQPARRAPRARTRRRPNYRLVKLHRSYTVEEIARLFGTHRNTVRDWVKRGLPTVDGKRPMLILGRDLAPFLQERRLKNKRPCQAGEIYCVRCRTPKNPAGAMMDYQPVTATSGSLVGICPTCEALMYRRVSLAQLDEARGKLEVRLPQADRRLGECATPIVNCDFERGA